MSELLTRVDGPTRVNGRRLPVAVTVGVLSVVLVWFNLRYLATVHPVDFLVYRYGADLAFAGGDLYGSNLFGPMMPDGGLPFTYPPFGALVLWPTTLSTPRTAYLVWSVGCLAVLGWVVHRFLPDRLRRRPLVAGAVFAGVASTSVVTQHLHFGQINLLLMGLVAADLFRSDRSALGRLLPRGVLVGLAAAVKLTPGLFIVYFVVTRQWRLAVWSTVAAVGAWTVTALILPAASVDFFTSVIITLGDRVDLDGGLATFGNGSITGALAALGSWATPATVPLVAAAAIGALLLARRASDAGRPVDGWLIVGLAAPLLSPVSWIHHWVWILPAMVVIVARHHGVRAHLTAAAVLAVLVVGPAAGQHLLDSGSPWLVIPGVLIRQCLMLTSVAGILLLATPRVGRTVSRRLTAGSRSGSRKGPAADRAARRSRWSWGRGVPSRRAAPIPR